MSKGNIVKRLKIIFIENLNRKELCIFHLCPGLNAFMPGQIYYLRYIFNNVSVIYSLTSNELKCEALSRKVMNIEIGCEAL